MNPHSRFNLSSLLAPVQWPSNPRGRGARQTSDEARSWGTVCLCENHKPGGIISVDPCSDCRAVTDNPPGFSAPLRGITLRTQVGKRSDTHFDRFHAVSSSEIIHGERNVSSKVAESVHHESV